MRPDAQRLDPLTIVAIAVVAYILANVLHEGVGHGGACVFVGCVPQFVTTAYFDGDSTQVGSGGIRLIAAAGTLVNLAAGLFFLWLHRRAVHAGGALRYFLWFAMTVNLLVATGYPLFSGVIGVGDWVTVASGWGPEGLRRAVLSITGLVLYAGAAWLSLRELNRMIGSDKPESVRRAVKLTTMPYVIGSAASTMGAFLNPIGPALVITSAAAHFGGTSAIAWMAQMLRGDLFPPVEGRPIEIPRSGGWIVLGAVLLAGHVLVLGRGVRF